MTDVKALARSIRIDIEDDLNDRRGIGWDCLDDATVRKIRAKHESLIKKRLSQLVAEVRREAMADGCLLALDHATDDGLDAQERYCAIHELAERLREGKE